jgi:DNA-binding GntR family transcriptional regulator
MRISGRRLLPGIARSLVRHANQSSRYLGAPTQEELVPPTGEIVAATIAEHERIWRAIAAGDPDGARAAMHDHIEIAWRRRRLDGDADETG